MILNKKYIYIYIHHIYIFYAIMDTFFLFFYCFLESIQSYSKMQIVKVISQTLISWWMYKYENTF